MNDLSTGVYIVKIIKHELYLVAGKLKYFYNTQMFELHFFFISSTFWDIESDHEVLGGIS